MKTPFIKIAPLFLSLTMLLGWACTEMYDFDRLSGMMMYDPEVDGPLVWGSLTAEDLFAGRDSLMENNGDTVVLAFREDSLFYFNAKDLNNVPPQDTQQFNLIPSNAITAADMPDSIYIDSTDIYGFTLENNMRIDSLFINEGFIMIEVSSSFKHAGDLTIHCPEIYIDGQVFQKTIPISSTDGMFYRKVLYPLTNAKIYPNNSVPGEPFIQNIYHLVLHRNPGQGIQTEDRVLINYSILELDKFEDIFGYAGDAVHSEDTVFSTGLEAIEGLTGTFSVIDPRINFTYDNSFGVPIGLDLYVLGHFKDGNTVTLDPPMQVMQASDNYLLPHVEGSLHYNRTNIPNIDELLTFPVPDSFTVGGDANANPGVTDAQNFILRNSSVLVGLDLKIPLAFSADLQLRDTFTIAIEKPDEADFIEYAKLHYRIRNEFPVNIDPYLILYDSIADVNRDTLWLAESLSDPFIKAAPVDANGVTVPSEVEDYTGTIELDEALMDHFFHDTNKLIIVGGFSSYQTGDVVILTTYRFDFRCNLEAKIHYVTNMNNKTNDK
jgi:hypothetical protein